MAADFRVVLKRIERAWRPSAFGDSKAAFKKRLEEYLEEGRGKLPAHVNSDPKRLEAVEAYIRKVGYSDWLDRAMAQPESVDIQGEGNVKFPDKAALLKTLRAALREWEDKWAVITTPPEVTTPKNPDKPETAFVPTTVSFS